MLWERGAVFGAVEGKSVLNMNKVLQPQKL